MTVKDKVAAVTGGGSGIGRAACTRLAQDGIAVAAWDISKEAAEETARLVGEAGGKAIGCEVDVSKGDQVKDAADTTRSAFGPVTIIVNSAAVSWFEPFLELTEEKWDALMAINLRGPFVCTQAVVPDMLEAGWGRIINISSSSAQQGSPGTCRYASSKGGVIGMTKALAAEFAPYGITVNHIPPGFIDTPMLRASQIVVEEAQKLRPMGRPGKPEGIAEAIAWLCNDNSDYVSGQTISVNGAYYMQ